MRIIGFITPAPVLCKILVHIGRRFDPLVLPGDALQSPTSSSVRSRGGRFGLKKTAGRGEPPPAATSEKGISYLNYYFFFIILFAGFFSPAFMYISFSFFLNCSSVKIARISFMAFNISK
jgi:hypothetical protein